jgi:hypothetical protein
MAKRYPSIIKVRITKEHIENGECGNSRNCMVGLAVQARLGLVHGYVHVDSTGVSITRRPDYREKALMPGKLAKEVCLHDEAKRLGLNPFDYVQPQVVTFKFVKTTKIAPKASKERRDQINKARRQRAAEGRPDRISYKRDRMAGIAIGPQLAGRLRRMKAKRLDSGIW